MPDPTSKSFSASCGNCDGSWRSKEAFLASGHRLFGRCPLRPPPDPPSGDGGYKRHLPASDQSTRSVGGVVHEINRAILTRCGQTQTRSMVDNHYPQLIVASPYETTCQRCLNSFAAAIVGRKRDPARDPAAVEQLLQLHLGWAERIRHGPAISEADNKLFRDRDKDLKRRAKASAREQVHT